jgi:hypothetical protein
MTVSLPQAFLDLRLKALGAQLFLKNSTWSLAKHNRTDVLGPVPPEGDSVQGSLPELAIHGYKHKHALHMDCTHATLEDGREATLSRFPLAFLSLQVQQRLWHCGCPL